jgi:nicotinamide riboside kinase
MIGLIGAESTGKSTIAMMLTGRLRTGGIMAELVAEAGSKRPFAPELLDSHPAAHFYAVTSKLASEAHAMLRSNVKFIVCDRTPFDLMAYYHTRFPAGQGRDELYALTRMWLANYDQLYYLPTKGATYVEDGFRATAKANTWRNGVDEFIANEIDSLRAIVPIEQVDGAYRERAEYVYHHVLSEFLGKTRPLRAYEQVRSWLSSRGWDVVEVRPQGSNSITRFHPSTDDDDIDAIVIVNGGADYAIKVRADIEAHREQLENIVQADLDLLVTPAGLEAHEA